MKPETYKKLLRDLQKVEKPLVAAYLREARERPDRLAQVQARWQAAEVGGRLDDFLELCARRSAVQLLLRTVYTRVLEDLGALTPPRIRGQWGYSAFRDLAPGLNVRAYLSWTFRDLARDFPALFTPGPDELPLPIEDHIRPLWDLWHAEDGQGVLTYGWQAEPGQPADFDSRFLGDLYQDLDAEVRKRFALLQTPVFVEEYILDHTLTPALAEFDPAALRDQGESFRVLDPTCGSGHFLIGAFHRMADWWRDRHGLEPWEAATRALESVWGADINPHAVDIARFRLLLEVRARTGVVDLERLAKLPLNLAVMDSLIPWERLAKAPELFPERDRLAKYATAEERLANAKFLGRAFHVVVGNPPYIRPPDVQKVEDYKVFWPDSATGRYALSAPFAERLIKLGLPGAYSGQITSNSFAKRSFGVGFITRVLPHVDLTHVVDTSGAYIPGHGTPTVILICRHRPPIGELVHAVLGKRGEPQKPDDAVQGLVWSAISKPHADWPSDSSPFVSFALIARKKFLRHPWTLSGGAAPAIVDQLAVGRSILLAALVEDVGNTTQLKADELYFDAPPSVRRDAECPTVELLEGEFIRDWACMPGRLIKYPYKWGTKLALNLPRQSATFREFWRSRVRLQHRPSVGFRTVLERGLHFYEFPFYAPDVVRGLSLGFAFVGTHNQFVLNRGGRLFKQSAYVLRLPDTATEEDHLDLLGLLNSSTLGFWMKQVFHCKGASSGEAIRSEDWEPFYEYDATKLKLAPLTTRDRPQRIALARALDRAAQERAACLPAAVLAGDWAAAALATHLAAARDRYLELTHQMVALQEELDWLTYQSYGLLEELEVLAPDAVEPLAPGHRPFEIRAAQAEEDAPDGERSAWWSRHGHARVAEIPATYSPAHRARLAARMEAIDADDRLQLLETFAFKRRWQLPNLHDEAVEAAKAWLLDRLEDLFAPGGPLAAPRPYRLDEIVAAWTRDPRIGAAARVYKAGADTDLSLVAEDLLIEASIPDNPRRVYTTSGLGKLDEWKAVWALQDREDAGEAVGVIPKPPEFGAEDFTDVRFHKIRGKLNVPRERFLRFDDLAPRQYGWNGWRDLDRGLAQVEAFNLAENDPMNPLPQPTPEDPRRCGVTLGLWESIDDVRRWSGPDHHVELQALAEEACDQKRCPCALVQRWQAWVNGELEVNAAAPVAEGEVTVEERAALSEVVRRYGETGASLRELGRSSGWPTERLSRVLDDLLASGHLEVHGRGLRRMYALPPVLVMKERQQKLF